MIGYFINHHLVLAKEGVNLGLNLGLNLNKVLVRFYDWKARMNFDTNLIG